MSLPEGKGRILGIGGVFLKSPDEKALSGWYQEKLGLPGSPGEPSMLMWRSHDDPDTEQRTVWSVFPQASDYFDPSPAGFMINYIVDDLDALLAKLDQQGVQIDAKREELPYGRFAWVFDPDGNKIELWEPRNPE